MRCLIQTLKRFTCISSYYVAANHITASQKPDVFTYPMILTFRSSTECIICDIHKVEFHTKFTDEFNTNYNISFGYPCKDTCSTCDIHVVKLKQLNNDIAACKDDQRTGMLLKEKGKIETAKKIHLI